MPFRVQIILQHPASQLRKLLEELKDYTPPLDLLAKLSPDAPLLAREAVKAEQEGRGAAWWKGFAGNGAKESPGGPTERERALVRVLSGEEELEALTTPKVSLFHFHFMPSRVNLTLASLAGHPPYRAPRNGQIPPADPLFLPPSDDPQIPTTLPPVPPLALPKRLAPDAGPDARRLLGRTGREYGKGRGTGVEECLCRRSV